jgi:hypothetical protein
MAAGYLEELVVQSTGKAVFPDLRVDAGEVDVRLVPLGWGQDADQESVQALGPSAMMLVRWKWSRNKRGSDDRIGRPHQSSTTMAMVS